MSPTPERQHGPLLTHFLLPDKEGDHKRQRQRHRARREHGQRGGLVARAHDAGDPRLQLLDVVEALADSLLDREGGVAVAQARGQLRAQDLLQDGRGDADADGGAERAEEVRARDDDRGVFLGGVGD